MTLKTALFAAAATLAIAPAANAYEGLYGAIGAGLNYIQPDQDVEGAGTLAFDSEADFENGIGVYTSLGKDWGKYRGELEFSYRGNDARHLRGDGAGFSGWNPIDGEVTVLALLANVIRDFETGGPVTPYLGVGFGGASVNTEYFGTAGAGTIAIDDKNKRFAYQAIAGLGIALAENLTLDLSYRYFATLTGKFDGTLDPVGPQPASPLTIRQDYDTHSLFAGLRWNFGAAAPAAPQYKDCWDGSSVPVASECPPQVTTDQTAKADPMNVIVYFDYDKSNLTAEASNLIKEAAARALANDIDAVVVMGHTDKSGGSAYNQALSERRSNVVRDALIANGISADRIRSESFGEDRPAKPTDDGVREPLNRRAEITISFQ